MTGYWLSVGAAAILGAIITHAVECLLIRQPKGSHHYGSTDSTPTLITGRVVTADDTSWPAQVKAAIAADPVPMAQFAAEQDAWYRRTHQLAIGASQAGG